ncbi:MAG TPA: ribokinase [Gaiellaceae bacterium]|nr:ribokinase [Gaiellaceae bacterium]
MPRSPAIAVVGSINLDLVARAERLPRPGETLTDATFERIPGGKGANQALAAARLGASVRLVGAVGDDPFADEALVLLREGGVDLEGVRRVPHTTGVALILVGGDGENEIVVAPGANRSAEAGDVSGADAVLCQLEIPVETVAEAARQARFFCLNAAPARELPPDVLGEVDLLVVNRYELEAVGRHDGLIALTLGPQGAVLIESGEEIARAAPPAVNAVDGTAAGDAFTACLLVSLLEERPRDEALRRACAAGAVAASRPGAQPSLPAARELDAILGS